MRISVVLPLLVSLCACCQQISSSGGVLPREEADETGGSFVEPDPLIALEASGTRFRHAPVNASKGRLACNVLDGVQVLRGATGVKYNRPPHVSASFAVKLAAFEATVQEVAGIWFNQRVARIEHLGTYVCRSVAGANGRISQHAIGNAIDISAFVLKNGVRVSVKRDFVLANQPVQKAAQHFLREVVERLREEGTFGVVLTPDWDASHRDHLHLDGGHRFGWWSFFS